MMDYLAGLKDAAGLAPGLRDVVARLLDVREATRSRNATLRRYYDGDVTVEDYGVQVDSTKLRNDQVCYWPEKAVTALSERIRLDGFVFGNGTDDGQLAGIVRDNNVITAFGRYESSKLTHGVMFATVNASDPGVSIRFHSAETAFAIPDGNHDSGVIGAGLVIARTGVVEGMGRAPVPTVVNLYTPGAVTVIERVFGTTWTATTVAVPERQPLMVAFTHKSTGTKPFGSSRITKAVRCLTDDAIRCMWRMEMSSSFYSIPQRYLLGLSDEQYDAMVDNKTQAYIDSMLLATTDENGNHPVYGQLTANSPTPFVSQLHALAGLFSGATGVPLNSLGIVQDNPSSAEAIASAREDICLVAEDDIAADGDALRRLMMLAMAVADNTTTDRLTDAQKSVMAHFKNPTIPSVAAQADAATKIATVDEGFAGTDVFYEMLGFDAATISRIRNDRTRRRGAATLASVLEGGVDDVDLSEGGHGEQA